MFSLRFDKGEEKDDYTIFLSFESKHLNLCFNLEAPVPIDISDSGVFNCNSKNGNFIFTWNSVTITFIVDEGDEVDGGSVTVNIKNTPKIMDSLQRCLKSWNFYLETLSIMPPGSYVKY
jgi:hypothetical protein